MTHRIAIIGAGPRALAALEALARLRPATLSVDLFEPLAEPGAGPNFAPDQSALCLLNLPLRALNLPPAPLGFPPLQDWLAEPDGERYPARAEVGAYLAARWQALAASAPFLLRLNPMAVRHAEPGADGWWLHAGAARHGPYAALLLTQGQPSSRPDEQLARWQDHAAQSGATLMPAYPAEALLSAAQGWAGKSVAIRGLGLATLDVLRLLTLGAGGTFRDGGYRASGHEPARILPFSRDGLPPWPKPANGDLDRRLAPDPAEDRAFAEALAQALRQADPVPVLCEALIPAARRILDQTGAPASTAALRDWLQHERDAPGSQGPQDARALLDQGIAMAEGSAPPDAGYVIGQLWRHWQPLLRRGFDPAPPAPETAAALLGFDEPLKRYAYGPPIGAARNLRALMRAGLVDLRAAEDPAVLLVPDGWQLVEGDASARAGVMIDAVLPGPDLARVEDPLLAALRDAGRVRTRGKGLGVAITPDGGTGTPGLAMLGRMTLGSVIAPDSIHDCFGAAADRWAASVVPHAGLPDSAGTYMEHS